MTALVRAGHRGVLVAVCAGLFLLTACSGIPDGVGVNSPTPAVMTDDAAKQQVHDRATRLITAIGNPEIGEGDVSRAPCGDNGSGLYDMAGIYQLIIPAEKQREALDRAKAHARDHGFEIAGEKDYPRGGGTFTAVNRQTGFDFTIRSGEPPAVVLTVVSACYRPGPSGS
jgi:hypothetical protein